MKILRKPSNNANYIATVAIGDTFIKAWEYAALPSWIKYCEIYDLGLIVFDANLIDEKHPKWKKSNWQRLLIPEAILAAGYEICNVCYLDTDIIISPIARNIFEFHDPEKIGVVSQINGLPLDRHRALRLLAFLRHRFLSERYPLDSALFMNPEDVFKFHSLTPFPDYVCTGVLVFSVKRFSSVFSDWFYRYASDVNSITGGGEEPILNYELQRDGRLNFLPYHFQALWIYEVATKYPFLFESKHDHGLVRRCIESVLLSADFLHFAGSWDECQMWKIGNFFSDESTNSFISAFGNYLCQPVTGKPVGLVRP